MFFLILSQFILNSISTEKSSDVFRLTFFYLLSLTVFWASIVDASSSRRKEFELNKMFKRRSQRTVGMPRFIELRDVPNRFQQNVYNSNTSSECHN